MLRKIICGLGTLIFAVWAFNTSLFTPPAEDGEMQFLAHRGVHQTYSREDLGIHACTATRIYEPTHGHLENTLASMRAAFEVGADVVEIDIHWTKDKHFAVFHDWDVGCRTEASGKVDTFTRAELKALDIGYGYTADGGKTFPFRGQFVGAMPMLEDVFEAFPDKKFLINLKANNTQEGEALQPVFEGMAGFSRASTKACLIGYVKWGWTGHIPQACKQTKLMIPLDYAPYLWGWPHKFTNRMKAAGTDVYLAGPYNGRRAGSAGINTPEAADRVSADFDGFIWTDRIEVIAPYLAAKRQKV